MSHEMYRVTGFEVLADYTLRVEFDDGTQQQIDFRPVLHGDLYGPLRDPETFAAVHLDNEAGTLVWPNGADFDPETLHNWAAVGPEFARMTGGWENATSKDD